MIFDNSQASTSTYTYDGSGNLASDALKDLSLFYNHLNLPTEINKGTSGEITKIYTASGTLVQKSVTESGNVNIEQYWGPFVYKDDVLSHIYHPEGRVRWIEDSALFRFDYFVKDHLGNVRTVITADEDAIWWYFLMWRLVLLGTLSSLYSTDDWIFSK